MSTSFRTATRTGLVGGAALLVAGLAATSASAESADLSYSCFYGVGQSEGSGSATATFDSGIGDGLVVEVGDEVELDPFTGSITVPQGFTDDLRSNEYSEIDGGGFVITLVDESGEEFVVQVSFPATPVPAEGPLTLQLTGQDEDAVVAEEGTNTLIASDVFLVVDTGSQEPEVGMYCELTDEGDVSIDAFEATAAATPTTTVTASPTASPVRPVVVQTDFAGEGRSTALPLLAGGGLAAASLALVVGRGARRGTARRH